MRVPESAYEAARARRDDRPGAGDSVDATRDQACIMTIDC